MVETTIKVRRISITVGRLLCLLGSALSLRTSFYGNVDFGWPPYNEFAIAIGMILLGLAIVVQDTLSGSMVAVWGAAVLVQAARLGNLYGSGGTYGTSVIIANALVVAYTALGLYLAFRKKQKVL